MTIHLYKSCALSCTLISSIGLFFGESGETSGLLELIYLSGELSNSAKSANSSVKSYAAACGRLLYEFLVCMFLLKCLIRL